MQANSSTSNSKKVRKNLFKLIRLIIFVIIVFILLSLIGNHFEKISNENQSLTYAKQALDNFYKETKEVDLIFLGSSHSYCTFDPEYFDEHTEMYSYQLGTPLQHPDTSYYMMREVLEYKNPKILIFEVYWDMLDDEFELKQADMFLSAVKNEELKEKYIKDVFPFNEKIKYNLKYVRYQQDVFAYYNKKLSDFVDKYKINKNPIPNYTEYYKDRGFLYTEQIISTEELYNTNQFRNINTSKWTINPTQKEYIIKLKNLCNKNGVKVLFVTAPIANISMEYIENYELINTQINKLAEELEIPYIDYNIINKNENLLSNENFYDDAHLNNSGAVIIQEHFINWLKGLNV